MTGMMKYGLADMIYLTLRPQNVKERTMIVLIFVLLLCIVALLAGWSCGSWLYDKSFGKRPWEK